MNVHWHDRRVRSVSYEAWYRDWRRAMFFLGILLGVELLVLFCFWAMSWITMT